MPKPIRFSGRSVCPVANSLDLLGDKWTLLIVRDMLLLGKRRFGELLRSDEGIPTNILADRLRCLEEDGIIRRRAYRPRPARYEYVLTRKGADLFPILREMARWANRHLPGPPCRRRAGSRRRPGARGERPRPPRPARLPGPGKSPRSRRAGGKTLRGGRRI